MSLGIYTRISKDRPNQLSTKEQRLQGIALAKKLELNYELYEEKKGTSGGKKIAQRPELNRLINDIESGEITAIYVYNQDRAERDELTWFTMVDVIIDNNVKLYENGIHQDLEDDDVRTLSGIKSIFNARSRRKTGSRIADILKRKASEGKATSPILPYGYKKDKKGFIVVDEEESDIVKRIFQMSLDGIGSDKTAMIFNEEGIKTRYAKNAKGTLITKNKITDKVTTKNKADVKWAGRTILQIIKNSWYYGERPYKGEVFTVPAILSKDYQLKVIDNLQKNRLITGKKTHKYLLKGIVKCDCGCNMYGVNMPSKNMNYYKCASKRIHKISCSKPSINRPKLDNLIWARFFKDAKLSELVKTHFKNTDEKQLIEKLELQLISLNKQLKNNQEEIDGIITYMSKKTITEPEGEKQLNRIRIEKNDIDTQILNTKNQLKTYKNILTSSKTITGELDDYRSKSSFNDKRTIIEKYIKSINVDFVGKHYNIKVEFNLPNINPEHLIVHRRFNYAVEPFKMQIGLLNPKNKNYGPNELIKVIETIAAFADDLKL